MHLGNRARGFPLSARCWGSCANRVGDRRPDRDEDEDEPERIRVAWHAACESGRQSVARGGDGPDTPRGDHTGHAPRRGGRPDHDKDVETMSEYKYERLSAQDNSFLVAERAGDTDEAARAAHSLKGLCSNFEAEPATAAAASCRSRS